MNAWLEPALHLIRMGRPVVLVTLVRTEGSTPREAGAHMLVADDAQWDTIGGGHLEWRALALARTLLKVGADTGPCRLDRLALGPSLGQCCGGVATLLLELLSVSDLPWIEELDAALQNRSARIRQRTLSGALKGSVAGAVSLFAPDDTGRGPAAARMVQAAGVDVRCNLSEHDGHLVLTEKFEPPALHVVLFGAGHVGQAVVRVLATLPCTVTWVDERDAQFPGYLPGNVAVDATDAPEAVVAQAPPHSSFLVMTHCHALDQRLCQAIFERDDFAYFGLIGSRTKRRKFERRLAARGVAEHRLERMTCPIGVPGIRGKAPEIIAVAVAAQLLQAHEQRLSAQGGARNTKPEILRLSGYEDELVYAD